MPVKARVVPLVACKCMGCIAACLRRAAAARRAPRSLVLTPSSNCSLDSMARQILCSSLNQDMTIKRTWRGAGAKAARSWWKPRPGFDARAPVGLCRLSFLQTISPDRFPACRPPDPTASTMTAPTFTKAELAAAGRRKVSRGCQNCCIGSQGSPKLSRWMIAGRVPAAARGVSKAEGGWQGSRGSRAAADQWHAAVAATCRRCCSTNFRGTGALCSGACSQQQCARGSTPGAAVAWVAAAGARCRTAASCIIDSRRVR